MKRRIVISLILFLSIVSLTSANVYAAAANTFKFTDTYVQKVGLTQWGWDVRDFGNFKITAKISLAGIDISKFNRDTGFYIYVGYFEWYCTLGEDLAYVPGGKKTSAKILVKPDDPNGDYYGNKVVSYDTTQVECKTVSGHDNWYNTEFSGTDMGR